VETAPKQLNRRTPEVLAVEVVHVLAHVVVGATRVLAL